MVGSGFVGAKDGVPVTYAIPSDNLIQVIVPAAAKVGLADTILVTNAQGSAKVVFQKSS